MRPKTIDVDSLIVGGGFAGCITAWILAAENERAVLLEKGASTAGMSGSFVDPDGNSFDYGRHVLNYGRTDLATRFFEHTLRDQVRAFTLQRGLLLRGKVIPYAAPIERWPREFRDHIRLDGTSRQVGVGSTRSEFAAAYGDWFADFVFDDVLSAFPTLMWRLEQGTPEEELLDWIFPWFFPLSDREAPPDEAAERGVFSAESRRYHYDTRHGDGERVLFPAGGRGFGQWLEAMIDQSAPHVEVRAELGDLDFEFEADSCRLAAVRTRDEIYRPQRVFWCAPLPILCHAFDWKLPEGEPQSFLLGNFTFQKPLDVDFHEVLSGDPDHRINRISFPGHIGGMSQPVTLQIEHLNLSRNVAERSDAAWLSEWEQSLREVGLVASDNRVRHAQLKRHGAGVATTSDLRDFSELCHRRLAEADSNLTVPGLTCTPDNMARRLPIVFADVYAALRRPMRPLPDAASGAGDSNVGG